MPSEKSLKIAKIILNGKTFLNTEWGKKNEIGLASMIENEVLGLNLDEISNDQGCTCPKCGQRGGVMARKDAYVNHAVPSNGNVDWSDDSDVTTFDETVYECVLCHESLAQFEIESKNNFRIQ